MITASMANARQNVKGSIRHADIHTKTLLLAAARKI